MVTDEIAEETGKDRKETLTDFLCSKTGKALYDEKTKLWCNGPAYIAELYREELKKQDNIFEMNAYPDGVENFHSYIVVANKKHFYFDISFIFFLLWWQGNVLICPRGHYC